MADVSQASEGGAIEFRMVSRKDDLARILNDTLGYPYFAVVVVKQRTVLVNGADANNAKVHLELVNKIRGLFAHNTTVVAAYLAPSNNDIKVFFGQ